MRRIEMDPKMEEAIRQRAYEIWEQEDRPEGRDLTHWLRARTEILDRELAAGASLSEGGVMGDPPGGRGPYIPTTTPESRGETSFAMGEKKHIP
jgi:hypothetical protein